MNSLRGTSPQSALCPQSILRYDVETSRHEIIPYYQSWDSSSLQEEFEKSRQSFPTQLTLNTVNSIFKASNKGGRNRLFFLNSTKKNQKQYLDVFTVFFTSTLTVNDFFLRLADEGFTLENFFLLWSWLLEELLSFLPSPSFFIFSFRWSL